MTNKEDICPKCRGAVVTSYGVRTCINCGAEPMTLTERQEWWRSHKDEIVKDW